MCIRDSLELVHFGLSDVADRRLPVLPALFDKLAQLRASLASELRHIEPNALAIVVRCHSHVRFEQSLLDVSDARFVKWVDLERETF